MNLVFQTHHQLCLILKLIVKYLSTYPKFESAKGESTLHANDDSDLSDDSIKDDDSDYCADSGDS